MKLLVSSAISGLMLVSACTSSGTAERNAVYGAAAGAAAGAVAGEVREAGSELARVSAEPSLEAVGNEVTVGVEREPLLGGIETEGGVGNVGREVIRGRQRLGRETHIVVVGLDPVTAQADFNLLIGRGP